jgi:hypothetical protein
VLFTPVDLEYALVKNVQIWCADMLMKSPLDRGRVPVGLNVYQGHVPFYQAGPRDQAGHPQQVPKAPSLAIRVTNGEYHRERGWAQATFYIVVWDDDLKGRGYIDAQNIINRVIYGLYENVIISQAFPLLDDPVKYEVIDDPAMVYHPYYFGQIQAKFGIMTPGPGWDSLGFHTDTGAYNDTGSDTLPVTAPEALPT